MSSTIRVLHVDDEPDFADLAATMLEREDARFEVVAASSAKEGLTRLNEATFDCVVSDFDMPHQNGRAASSGCNPGLSASGYSSVISAFWAPHRALKILDRDHVRTVLPARTSFIAAER